MSEADAMWQAQLCGWGAEQNETPTHEVIVGKRQDVIFKGSRAACWAFKRKHGGFVREYSGEFDHE